MADPEQPASSQTAATSPASNAVVQVSTETSSQRETTTILREPLKLAPTWMKAAFLVYYVALLGGIGLQGQRALSTQLATRATATTQPPKVEDNGPGGGTDKDKRDGAVEKDFHLIFLVILAGALGGVLHGLASLETHTGRRQLYAHWWVFYLARPYIGAGMATAVYAILRGGITGTSLNDDNPWVPIAWASLSGLFSTPALAKLKDIFQTTFFSPEQSGDTRVEKKTTTTQESNVLEGTDRQPKLPGEQESADSRPLEEEPRTATKLERVQPKRSGG